MNISKNDLKEQKTIILKKMYSAWKSMIQRCEKHNHKDHKYYGGRGIAVCTRWHSFENFLADMGLRPEGLSLERIDNNGNYAPGNCKWATKKIQNGNTCKQKLFLALGPQGQVVVDKNQHRFARFWKLKQSCISRCLSKYRKNHGGWIFEYIVQNNL